MTQLLEHIPVNVLGARPGGHALIALAHPDDEFMIGGAIDALRSNDVTVHAVIATDGEGSDRGDPHLLRKSYRRGEANDALRAYGIAVENQHFLGLPDGSVTSENYRAVISSAVSRLLRDYDVESVITLGDQGYDGHTDHSAVHEAARAALPDRKRKASLYGLSNGGGNVYIAADPAAKLRRLVHHETQFGIDLTNSSYQPKPGTIEQPGIRLTEASREYLSRYIGNMSIEHYIRY